MRATLGEMRGARLLAIFGVMALTSGVAAGAKNGEREWAFESLRSPKRVSIFGIGEARSLPQVFAFVPRGEERERVRGLRCRGGVRPSPGAFGADLSPQAGRGEG